MSLNKYPFWVRKQLERLKPEEAQINLHTHIIRKICARNLEEEKIVETVKKGKVILMKSLRPGKIVFQKYYGKENETYIVVTIFMKYHIEVRTAWKKTGK